MNPEKVVLVSQTESALFFQAVSSVATVRFYSVDIDMALA
jgi:hypothetical protein